MKKIILPLFIVLFGTSLAFSQPMSNLVFFSEDGYPFHVIMNGIQENQNYQTNVKITELTAPNYKVKIIFKDKTIPNIEKNVYTKPDMEVTYVIKKNKNGVNIIRYYSEAPVVYDVVEEVVVVHDDNHAHNDVVVREEVYDNSGGIHVDVNINESGINANIDINETDAYYNENVVEHETHYVVEEGHSNNIYHMPGYSGPVGCDWPMSPGDFQNARNTISNADFEDDKLTISKQIVGMNCLTVQQVKQLGMLFDFEDTKLEFAKFAYGRTFDLGNYYQLNDMFDFSSSIDELNKYINSHR